MTAVNNISNELAMYIRDLPKFEEEGAVVGLDIVVSIDSDVQAFFMLR